MRHTKPPTTRRPRGITLIEMMVALAITSFAMLVINQIFNEVVTTVARGTQGGEILQKSRTLDEQLAIETELQFGTGDPDATNPTPVDRAKTWQSRMVGPLGRDGVKGGTASDDGLLVILQREVQAPLTLKDAIEGRTRTIRSDQLMFIYDQKPGGNFADTHRLPPLAPSSDNNFAGDMQNSLNADYVRMWYGHVLQLRETDEPDRFTPADIPSIELGALNATNPNAIAQDWVLGRQALFLTGEDRTSTPPIPVGRFAEGVFPSANIQGTGGSGKMWQGMSDVSNWTLQKIHTDTAFGLDKAKSLISYQTKAIAMAYSIVPLLTNAKLGGTLGGTLSDMKTKDTAPAHTFFMGGVSDFIVEFAGDLVNNNNIYTIQNPTQIGPDGELDRDPDGRIKWYTHIAFSNPKLLLTSNPGKPDQPVTYPTPLPKDYPPYNVSPPGTRADAAFVFGASGSPEFRSWPWMIRIRYRLHDRRGNFVGRDVTVNTVTGETRPEPGMWFETIIPVNYQAQKP